MSLAPSGSSYGIAVDATSVYWAATADGKVMKVDKNGGVALTLASGDAPLLITVDDANVYWTQYRAVMKVPTAGGTAVQLATALDPAGIAVDGNNVYFTTGDGKIMQVPKNGGDALTLASDLGNDPWAIAVDGENVYGASITNGTIVKIPVGGGASQVLASADYPMGVAVDANYVYWAEVGTYVGGCAVMRVVK
jgi:hypothetical protein